MPDVACDQCGKATYKRPRDIVKAKHLFCSTSCHSEYVISQRHTVSCVGCGVEFELRTCEVKRAKLGRNYCSPNCVKRYMKRERHRSWKPEKTSRYIMPPTVRAPGGYESMGLGEKNRVGIHRLAVARHLGRPLFSEETVHHIDHDTQNNSLGNLMLFETHSDHIAFERNGIPTPIFDGSCV